MAYERDLRRSLFHLAGVQSHIPVRTPLKESSQIGVVVAHSLLMGLPIADNHEVICDDLSTSIISCMRLWKTSGAELMPEGMRNQRYRPKGVLNIVRYEDGSSSSICQKPLLTSNTETPEHHGVGLPHSRLLARDSAPAGWQG